ncbi:MAG: hypothetical protein ACXV9S_03245 [Acidimicrobiia bacterium]
MAIDADLSWRKCPTCGYLVPAQQTVCSRCANASGSIDPKPAPIPPDEPAPRTAPDVTRPMTRPALSLASSDATHPLNPKAAEEAPEPTARPDAAFDASWSAPVRVGSGLLPPAPPRPAASGGDTGSWRRISLVVLAALVALALVAGLLRVTVFADADAPLHWDARLGDLPATVARLRGLRFVHPVPVRAVSQDRFVKEQALGSTKTTKRERVAADRLAATFRALGLVSGPVDLIQAARTAQENRVLAFYDPDRKEIVIRGGTRRLDAPHRVVLAHELTHVLQDQHFDLNAMQARVRHAPGQASDALRGFVEGDAVRIEQKYLSGLSKADRASFRRWERRSTSAADAATKSVPAVLSVTQSAPYVFGPSTVKVVAADGGNGAVDRVFRDGVFTQKVFVEPTASLTEPAPEALARPRLAAGEKAVGRSQELGAFDLYLLLGAHGDAGAALAAADGWKGGRYVTVRHGGDTCVRATVVGTSAGATRAIETELRSWSGSLPAGTAEVRRRGVTIAVHSCDPGATSSLAWPDAGISQAANLLAAHNELEAGLVKQSTAAGVPVRFARCAALELVRSPQLTVLLSLPEDQVTSKQVQQAVEDAAPAVRDACGL